MARTTIQPVSYTHLDVYKRQPYTRLSTRFVMGMARNMPHSMLRGRAYSVSYTHLLPVYSVKAAVRASASRPLKKIRYLGGELLLSLIHI